MTNALAYAHLPRQEQAAYRRYLAGLRQGNPVLESGQWSVLDPLKVLQAVTADHPELIWFAPSAVQVIWGLPGKQARLQKVLPPPARAAMSRELESALNRALEEIHQQGALTDYDRLLCAYEYIQRTVVYDEGEKNRLLLTGQGDFLSHNAYGALVRRRAVCDGIAAAFCLLAQRMGLTACTLSGKAQRDGGDRLGHTWVLVSLAGDCCHLDPTWDLNRQALLGVPGYDYFCLDDGTISLDHDWDTTRAPRCRNRNLSWFHRNRLCVNNLTQTRELLERLAKTRATVLRLRLAEGVALPGNQEEETLGKLLQDAYTGAGKAVSLRYSWNPEVRTLTCLVGQQEPRNSGP